MSKRYLGWALIGVGAAWLAIMTIFVLAGLSAGKVQDAAAAILGIGVFGGVPALILWAGGAVLLLQGKSDKRETAKVQVQEEILERVETRGKCNLDELARELDVRPSEIDSGIYDLVGKKLFTGYVNWKGREIIAAEAEKISGDHCPNCGGQIELAGKDMARCPYCGTEIFLSKKK